MAAHNRWQYLEDEEIVSIARSGSLEACDEIVRRFRGAVLMVAGQVVGTREVAEDVAQESFLLAFSSLPQLQDTAKFAGWLYTITRHRARRVAQQSGRSECVESSALEYLLTDQGENESESPLDALLRTETEATVRQMLADLAPPVQNVLYLFYYEEWPAPRIAAFLSLPLTTVKWRLHTGKRQLHSVLATYLEGENNVRSESEERDSAASQCAAEDDGTRRTHREHRHIRKRSPQCGETLQRDCGAAGRAGSHP